jgi:hypothetical protein
MRAQLIVVGRGWLFSSFLLKNKIFIAYFMAIILSCDTIGSIVFLGSEKTCLSSDIVFLWVLPLAPAVSVISGSTFQPLALMSLIKPKYLSVFSWMLSGEYLSLQYVNSMNCTVSVEFDPYGGSVLYGWFRMHRMSGLSLALHWHLCVWLLQLHGSSQLGIVFSCACSSDFPAFAKMKQRDLALDIIILRTSWTALLCLLMRSLCMWGSVQQSSMCSHVSGCIMLHSEQFMLG